VRRAAVRAQPYGVHRRAVKGDRRVGVNDQWPVPPFVAYIIGYVFVLAAALVVVNVVLHRLTRRERTSRRRPPAR